MKTSPDDDSLANCRNFSQRGEVVRGFQPLSPDPKNFREGVGFHIKQSTLLRLEVVWA